jgi:hypothetical protein
MQFLYESAKRSTRPALLKGKEPCQTIKLDMNPRGER